MICSAYGWVMQTIVQAYVSAEFTSFMFSLEAIFIGVLLVTYQPKKDKQSILLQEKVNY